jgi:hypothetical protein
VRRVLEPKWWLLHVTVLAAVLVMLRLGLWQWHRANSASGGIQNYAYAFQWPLFAVFALVLWGKTLLEEVRRDPNAAPLSPGTPVVPGSPDTEIVRQPGVRVGISVPAPEATADDPEVAAWNARLAALNAVTTAIESRGR